MAERHWAEATGRESAVWESDVEKVGTPLTWRHTDNLYMRNIHMSPTLSNTLCKHSCINSVTPREPLSRDDEMKYSHVKISSPCFSLSHSCITQLQPRARDITHAPCMRCVYDMCYCMFSLGSCRLPSYVLCKPQGDILWCWCILAPRFEPLHNKAQGEKRRGRRKRCSVKAHFTHISHESIIKW